MGSHGQQLLDGKGVDPSQAVPAAASARNGTATSGSGTTNGHVPPTDHNHIHHHQSQSHHHHRPQHKERSPYLHASPLDCDFDLICVGFGPASLAIAVALHDALSLSSSSSSSSFSSSPKVLFVEKQVRFAWHAGMLLPGAKMQISFVKDLATLRDPRSEFTFLNYLHRQGRLVDFANLATFLPARAEYEDYLRWCASFFGELVRYGEEVVSVAPARAEKGGGGGEAAVRVFEVVARDVETGLEHSYRGRNVLLATGGRPSLPKCFPAKHPRIIHSSQFAHKVPQTLAPDPSAPHRIVVVGAGQSAAEIFCSLQTLYPRSRTRLVMRQDFLRPSDDSPFVNTIFNPDYIDNMFPMSSEDRTSLLADARSTNYGVVRLPLLEEIYERMYDQRRELGPDESTWPHRILGGRHVVRITSQADDGALRIHLQRVSGQSSSWPGTNPDDAAAATETLDADLVIAATGYQRTAHVDMLQGTWTMLPRAAAAAAGRSSSGNDVSGWTVDTAQGERRLAVGRDYQVMFEQGAVAEGSGVWLQGCCEGTHGLSDTLLSVLATRSGQMVESIFGSRPAKDSLMAMSS